MNSITLFRNEAFVRRRRSKKVKQYKLNAIGDENQQNV